MSGRGDGVDAQHDATAGFKIVPPAIDGTLDRPSALAALRRAQAPGRWFSGPSGSGKSTLVAQHLAAASARCIWYRLDARDNDPAFFYRSFASVVSRRTKSRRPLPAFADDDRGREDAFAERFFAELLHRHAGFAFVLDNVHLAGNDSIRRALTRFALLAPPGSELWFVGEDPPPPAYFDAIAARQLALCNDVPLAFDAAECQALARASRVETVSGDDLAALTGGHAAALVLACEFLRSARDVDPAGADRAVGHIHRYLLARLLARMPQSRRDVLLRTCFAPQFTAAIARALAGPGSDAELEPLRAHGLLRHTRSEHGSIYEAHGLVRTGLVAMLGEHLDAQGVQALAEQTAEALAREGFDEDAFVLLADRGLAERAADLLVSIAERYARHGQAQLLLRAAARLPAALADARPWLCFWSGQALLGFDEETARGWFERAYAAFEREGNTLGMRLAAARVVMAFGLEYSDLRAIDAWMARHDAAGGNDPVAPGTAYESVLCIGTVCAALTRGSHAPGTAVDALVARLRTLIDDDAAWLTPDEPVIAARLLVDHGRIFSTPDRAQTFFHETRARAERADASPLQRGRFHIAACWAFYIDGQHRRAQQCLDEARRLLDLCGSGRLAFELGMVSVDAMLKRHDLAGAAAQLAALEQDVARAGPAQRADYARIKARTLLLQGDAGNGLLWAEQAIQTAALAGYSGAHARDFAVDLVYALAANERYAEAVEAADRLAADLEEQQREAAEVIRETARFFADGERDLVALEGVLARAEALAFVNLFSRARSAVTRLCAIALRHGIHADFVRRMIAVQRLSPPAGAGPEWPWPVTLRTLGTFELVVAGERYQPPHKTQDKPLELLKLLVTCEALGRDSADRDFLAERLWPDAEGPNARKSLETTLARLRKLLRDDDAVVLSEGRMRLSETHVWTDVRPLMRALQHVRAQRDEWARGSRTALAAAVGDIGSVLDHYHGRFLPEEGDAPWLIAGREAIAAAVRSALVIADAVLAGRESERLIAALERAFAADPTSEDLARALMRAWSARGQHAEAIRVYRRLREMLSVILALPPSRETESLKDDLYASVPAGGVGERALIDAQGRSRP
jgi:ATP/maltotriose-dependent transcriptional regulator MalT/DNA-binding SARP family transcriptional activator